MWFLFSVCIPSIHLGIQSLSSFPSCNLIASLQHYPLFLEYENSDQLCYLSSLGWWKSYLISLTSILLSPWSHWQVLFRRVYVSTHLMNKNYPRFGFPLWLNFPLFFVPLKIQPKSLCRQGELHKIPQDYWSRWHSEGAVCPYGFHISACHIPWFLRSLPHSPQSRCWMKHSSVITSCFLAAVRKCRNVEFWSVVLL